MRDPSENLSVFPSCTDPNRMRGDEPDNIVLNNRHNASLCPSQTVKGRKLRSGGGGRFLLLPLL